MPRREVLIAEGAEVPEGGRKVFALEDGEVGVYRVQGKLYAYQNLCAHQGGPACEGLLMPKVEEVISEEKTYVSRRFNYEEWHIVCPWHGWEYEVTTGEFAGDRKYRLKRYEVRERDGKIYVVAGS